MLKLSTKIHNFNVEYGEFIKKLGLKIKELRISRGITQEAMEEGENGISYRTVQDIENGQSHPSVRSVYRISKRLGVEPKSLFSFSSEADRNKIKNNVEEYRKLYNYYKKSVRIKYFLKEKIKDENITKDDLMLYLSLWFNFLYLVIDTAIFHLQIKSNPFDMIYNFKTNTWINELIPKLKAFNLSTSTFTDEIIMSLSEIDQLTTFCEYLESMIFIFFNKKIIDESNFIINLETYTLDIGSKLKGESFSENIIQTLTKLS